jgi:DNA-binding response OmpR family regulator
MYRKKSRTGSRPKLLVVDDDPQILRLTQILFRSDFDGLIANSGEEAEVFVGSHQPDLVIVDLGLPDISGVDLARKIRAMPGSEAVPILMLTGNEGAEADSLRAGIDDFVSKPFEKDVLKARVENLLHRTGRR